MGERMEQQQLGFNRSSDSGRFSFDGMDLLNTSSESVGGGGGEEFRPRSATQSSIDELTERRRIIPIGDITFLRELGEGSFGVVYHARFRDRDVAAKCLFNCALFEAEACTLSTLSHRNVIGYVGESHFMKGNACMLQLPPTALKTVLGNCVLLTEFASRGTLHDLIYSDEVYSLRQAIKWMSDIASGLAYLHTGAPSQILHLDLKPLNILITADGELKIADLGTSCPGLAQSGSMLFLPPRPSVQGTTRYMAPEVIRGEEYNERADVWSFAVTCWEILVRDRPHPQLTNDFSVAYNVGAERLHPIIPECFPEQLSMMLIQCWQHSPSDRLSASDCRHTLQNILRTASREVAIAPNPSADQGLVARTPIEVLPAQFSEAVQQLRNLAPCAGCEESDEEEEEEGQYEDGRAGTRMMAAHADDTQPPPLIHEPDLREARLFQWETELRSLEARLLQWQADLEQREHAVQASHGYLLQDAQEHGMEIPVHVTSL